MRRLGRPALVVCSVLVGRVPRGAGGRVERRGEQRGVRRRDAAARAWPPPRSCATGEPLAEHEHLRDLVPHRAVDARRSRRLDRNGELPALDVSTADVLTAREYVQTVIGDASEVPGGSRASVLVSDGTPSAAAPGCVAISPTTPGTRPVVLLELPSAGLVPGGDGPGPPTASLSFVRGRARGNHAQFTTEPDGGIGVGVSRGDDIELTLPRDHHHALRPGYRGAFGSADHGGGRLRPWMSTDELLDDDQVLIADAIRELCTGFDDDYWARCDREHEFPWDFYAAPGRRRLARTGDPRGVRRRRTRHHRRGGDAARDRARAARR